MRCVNSKIEGVTLRGALNNIEVIFDDKVIAKVVVEDCMCDYHLDLDVLKELEFDIEDMDYLSRFLSDLCRTVETCFGL